MKGPGRRFAGHDTFEGTVELSWMMPMSRPQTHDEVVRTFVPPSHPLVERWLWRGPPRPPPRGGLLSSRPTPPTAGGLSPPPQGGGGGLCVSPPKRATHPARSWGATGRGVGVGA